MNIRTFLILANFLQLIPRLFIRLDWQILCALLPIGKQNCLQCFNAGGRPSIRPVNTTWLVAGVVICLEWGADDLNMVQSSWCHYEAITACFIEISEWFIFLLPVWPIVCQTHRWPLQKRMNWSRCRLRVPKELCNTEPCITQRSILAPPGEYDRTVGARRRCGLMSNNFGHLLLLQRGQQAGGKSCIAWRRVRWHARWCRLVGGWSAGYRWLVDDVV